MQQFTQGIDGETIEHEGFTLTLQHLPDYDSESPEIMNEGFWPSLNPDDAGYIGENPLAPFDVQLADAYKRMAEYGMGHWWYMGVQVVVHKAGVRLGDASLWGIESDCDESYFAEVANELIYDALAEAKQTIANLTK